MKKIIIFFIILSTISFGNYLTGKVIKVYDGDTITILTAQNKKLKIRLYGIDAPEINQSFGNKSKDFLKSILYKKKGAKKNKIGLWTSENILPPWEYRKLF